MTSPSLQWSEVAVGWRSVIQSFRTWDRPQSKGGRVRVIHVTEFGKTLCWLNGDLVGTI